MNYYNNSYAIKSCLALKISILTDVQYMTSEKKHSCETHLLVLLLLYHYGQTDINVLNFWYGAASTTIKLVKLVHHGIRGKSHAWIAAFLNSRTQKVAVDEGNVGCSWGGIRGSTENGPWTVTIPHQYQSLAFNMSSRLCGYLRTIACYIVLFIKYEQDILQFDLDALELWAARWGMRFNVSKYNILKIARTTT